MFSPFKNRRLIMWCPKMESHIKREKEIINVEVLFWWLFLTNGGLFLWAAKSTHTTMTLKSATSHLKGEYSLLDVASMTRQGMSF